MITTQEHKFYFSFSFLQKNNVKYNQKLGRNMKFPNRLTSFETFYEYLKDILVYSKSLTQEQVKKIFLRALKDYFDGNINLECLAVVATQLYYELNKPYEVDLHFNRDLAGALFDATEIDWYHDHQNEDPNNKEMYEAQLKALKNFYKKNKNLLKA